MYGRLMLTNLGFLLMVNVTYMVYMDPMGMNIQGGAPPSDVNVGL